MSLFPSPLPYPPPSSPSSPWRRALAALLLAACVLSLALPAPAQMPGKRAAKGALGQGGQGGKGRAKAPAPPEAARDVDPAISGAFFPTMANKDAMSARGFFATGLTPAYPEDAACPEITSGFAAATRSDGSRRSPRYFQGLHSGVDIPVPEGTPILAMADGTVVHMAEGLNIGGIGLTLRHSPQDTGLGVWIYTEYKHLRELPELAVGRRVRRGEPIAVAGATGTAGAHYGEEGFSHLHLAAMSGDGEDFRGQNVLVPVGGRWLDPLALFLGPPVDSQAVTALPEAQRRAPVAYQRPDGTVVPPEARVVWPFVCVPR